MKILKIFGIAVAVHAAFFMLVAATPGCRSTSRQGSSPAAHGPALPDPSPTIPGAIPGGPSAGAPKSVSSSVNGSELNPGVSPSSPAGVYGNGSGIHFNPTRPGTHEANVLQTGPVADVTPASTYTVVKNDSLSTVAKKHGITMAELSLANNLKKESVLRLGQRLIIPAKTAPSPVSPVASLGGGDTLAYEVKAGENLATIAKHSGTTVAAIRALNKLTNDRVRPGQKLILPAGASVVSSPTAKADPETATAPAKPAAAPATGTKYTVKSGEGLGQIAKKFGVRLSDIAEENNISDPKKLRAGQEIIIPSSKGKTNVNGAAAAQHTGPATLPTPASEPTSPIAPAPAEPTNPISAPPGGDTSAPVIKIDEGSPVGPAKS